MGKKMKNCEAGELKEVGSENVRNGEMVRILL